MPSATGRRRATSRSYVDGARMASGCTAQGGDLTIQHIAARADAFTLGGTKNACSSARRSC